MAVDLNELRIPSRPVEGQARRGWIWAAAVVIVLGGAAVAVVLVVRQKAGAMQGIEVATAGLSITAGEGSAPRSFTAGGWVEAAFPWPAAVSALTEGRVEEVLVQEGQDVAEGQVIARLYAGDIDLEVKKDEADLEVARARLALLEAGTRKEDIAEGEARLRELEAEEVLLASVAARSAKLSFDGSVSKEQAEKDAAAVGVQQARVEAQRAAVERLRAGPRKEEIDAARAEVKLLAAGLEISRTRRGYVEVRSPSAGRILRRLVEPGKRVGAENRTVATIYSPSAIWVRVDVAQADLARVRLGQSVEVQTDAEPERTFPGVVQRIDPNADFAKNTITVRIRLDETNGRLHPDMTARVHFSAPEASPGSGSKPAGRRLLAPRVALVRQGGATYLYELSDGKAVRRTVESGGTVGDAVEILSGISPGARVILSPPEGLADGAKVREKK